MPGGRRRRPARGERRRQRPWLARFVARAALWAVPVWALWAMFTPVYNLFLTEAAESLVRLGERPAVTRLEPQRPHHLVITRTDVGAGVGLPTSVRVTDVHFHLVLLAALFLAVPDVPPRLRLERLGWALLVCIFFHLVDLVFWVKFVYATQMGSWSARHYGPFGQNFWGLGKHLLDLPVKLALPLLLWVWFHLRELAPALFRPTR